MQEVNCEANSEIRIELVEHRAENSLYRFQPLIGKKHQLRVHMAALGMPIVNDIFYPDVNSCKGDDWSSPLKLLARVISFQDPVSDQRVRFESCRTIWNGCDELSFISNINVSNNCQEQHMRSTRAAYAIERLNARSLELRYSMVRTADELFILAQNVNEAPPIRVSEPLQLDTFVKFVNAYGPQILKRISKLDVAFEKQLQKKNT